MPFIQPKLIAESMLSPQSQHSLQTLGRTVGKAQHAFERMGDKFTISMQNGAANHHGAMSSLGRFFRSECSSSRTNSSLLMPNSWIKTSKQGLKLKGIHQ